MLPEGVTVGEHSGKAWGCAIHELNTALTHNYVISRAQPEVTFIRAVLSHDIRQWVLQVFNGFDDLVGEERGHATIQDMTEIGDPDFFFRNRVK